MTQTHSKAELLASLAEDASYLRPDLFAIYGIDSLGNPFLGWGIQLCEDKTVYYDPKAAITHLSTSADQVLRIHQIAGEAHLCWLEN